MKPNYDVIVIGGGHAGAEAAWAAAHLGARTALLTFRRDAIGRMSCNPAIGGIGKGQMVREIDALGGLMGRVADETGIQFRMLNRRKGPALWAPRAQSDALAYPQRLREYLEQCPNLDIVEAGVDAVEVTPITNRTDRPNACVSQVGGVRLHDGRTLRAGAVIITSGTFLRGLMHTGEDRTEGGRIGESAAVGLSKSLEDLGLNLGRLKTGTPPRVHRDSVEFAPLVEQPGDADPVPFSFLHDRVERRQIPCWITYTNPAVHDLIRANLDRAPMYSGQIESLGPRYCPSIETKVMRFADKDRHQIFLEPEGYDSERIYVNGISTSLPIDVQDRMVHGIEGLEQARVLQWGYAVEYDFVPPEQIDATLMTKRVQGLFLAGQINGTSGYEEAAGQGLVAGVNAAHLLGGRPPLFLGRDEAYVGVMIDDLVTRGVLEPYRMFTSRAEHRLQLRYDNADLRLTPIGRRLGLVDEPRWIRYETRKTKLEQARDFLRRTRHEGICIEDWLRRPEEDGRRFLDAYPELAAIAADADVWAHLLVDLRYEGYVRRQERLIAQFHELEDRAIPAHLDYRRIRHLRHEAVERLSAVRPRNLGQASRVTGIHPTDISILLVELTRP